MSAYRGYILTLATCVAIEAGIFYGMVGLGANGEFVAEIETIWLCVAVVLTLLIGGHFYPEGSDDRGD
jgi:hypothetical protein